eukprot:9040770-Pyramimonas_sp.AAC.1
MPRCCCSLPWPPGQNSALWRPFRASTARSRRGAAAGRHPEARKPQKIPENANKPTRKSP